MHKTRRVYSKDLILFCTYKTTGNTYSAEYVVLMDIKHIIISGTLNSNYEKSPTNEDLDKLLDRARKTIRTKAKFFIPIGGSN